MKHRDGQFEAIAKAVASWSVGVNANIARLVRVRDLIHKDLADHAHNRERPPTPRGLGELADAIGRFETLNLRHRSTGDTT